MIKLYSVLRLSIVNFTKDQSKSYLNIFELYCEDLLRHSLKLGAWEEALSIRKARRNIKYPRSTIINRISLSIQQGSLKIQRGYFVVPEKNNVTILIPAKNSVFVLERITLVLEKDRFLNEYRLLYALHMVDYVEITWTEFDGLI